MELHKMQQFLSQKRIRHHKEAFKGKEECTILNITLKMLLTLRAVLHRARRVAGGAEFVHHACDVFHLPVDHSLDIVHVEQVEALQTTLQNRDLAPGVAQADRHPVQLHL